jgi:hypothetical protein
MWESREFAEDSDNPCWDGYAPEGMKPSRDGSGRMVPNCVKLNEEFAEVGPRGGIRESDKAPKSDTPNPNPKGEGSAKGDASGKRGAEVSASQEKSLQKKIDEFNERESNTKNGNATLGAVKSVFQRGLGAYNTSRSPNVRSAEQWAMARVNAYLYLLKNGRPERKAYVQDNDLLPNKHPKATKMSKEDFSFEKVSFDWDGVLTTERGRNLFKNEINRGNEVFIVSSRNTAPKEMQEFIRKYTLNPTRVYTVGSDRNKIERIKSLGIERHYDDNLQIRRELGKVAAMFDYDVSALPAYESTSGSTMEVKPFLGSDCGCGDPMMMSQEQMDVFGYKTKNFDICPGAQDLFTHITSMPMDEDTKGMVRSAAQIADNVFEIEREVLIRGYSTEEELAMAKILVDDFKDLMKEIDALVGMNHDVSFMDNHIELITAALDDPQYWDEDEKELFAAVNFFKENPDKKPLNFNQFFTGLNRGDILGKTVFRNNTKFYEYAVKVSGKEPTRKWCEPREGQFFRRGSIDLLNDGNQKFGPNGNSPYSKWLYKGGPQCVHAWKQYTYMFEVGDDGRRINERLQENGFVDGMAGQACNETPGACYLPDTARYKANLSKVVSQTYMDEKQFGKCFGEFCNINFTKSSDQMFSANEEQRMIYSPLMIPNLLIPRIGEDGEKYFVKFTPEAIERIQRKFMIQQRLRETNLEHTDKKFNDVVMVESWIVNGNSDKSYTLGFTPEQVPTGSWMVGYKVLDTTEGDIIWNEYIKPGKVKGISAEGNFLLNFSKQAEDEYLLGEIIKILNKITE